MTDTQSTGAVEQVATADDETFALAHGGPRPGRIFKAMIEVLREVDAIGKGRTGPAAAGSYKFRGIDDVFNALHPLFAKHGIFLLPDAQIRELRTHGRGNEKSPMTQAYVTQGVTFLADDGSFVRARTVGEGSDAGDKSCNKAMSAAMKYALLQTFAIPTEEQKDSEYDHPERPPQRQGPPPGPSRSSAPANGPQGVPGRPTHHRAPRGM